MGETGPVFPEDLMPAGWSARPATGADIDGLVRVAVAHERSALGRATTSRAAVEAAVTGPAARARQHRVVTDAEGAPVAWGALHDRAAGRVVVGVLVDPALPGTTGDGVAAGLFAWALQEGRALAFARGLEATQLDAGAFATDERQHRWLTAAGYSHVRTWWQMSRPVAPEEGRPGAFPDPSPGVVVRQVIGEDGEPTEEDLRKVHDVLEAAFSDHFNYHEETFDEFVERQRQEVGHAWDHWWLAEVDRAGPAGALVGEAVAGGDGEPDGSYVGYLGVTRLARGRGVARSLLHAVIADAARRGRDHVGLEVDADSPTGATRLYGAMGFRTQYVTESWHRDVLVR